MEGREDAMRFFIIKGRKKRMTPLHREEHSRKKEDPDRIDEYINIFGLAICALTVLYVGLQFLR